MRDSKNILHSKLGVSPMERQYGGGLDDAYMNRRRSNAFADPNANTAFASPMSQGGLPTVYREQGGNIPITSVYGQGIPRIIYREIGGPTWGDYPDDAAFDAAMASGPPEAEFGAEQYPSVFVNTPRPTGITTEKNQATMAAQMARQNAMKAAREADRGIPPEAEFGAGKLEEQRREAKKEGVIDFWKDPNNILAIRARQEEKEKADKYWYSTAEKEAKNKEAEKQRQHVINTAGSIYPGLNILTGKPLTKQEQTLAALNSSFTPVIERNPLGFIHGNQERIDIVKANAEREWAEGWEKEQAEKEDMEKRDSEYAKTIADHRIRNSNLSPDGKDEVYKDLRMATKDLTGSKEARAIYDTLNILLKGAETNRKTGGGLSTIYRSEGGYGLGEYSEADLNAAIADDAAEDLASLAEFDQADADAGAASLADDAPNYATLDKTGQRSEAASRAADLINIGRVSSLSSPQFHEDKFDKEGYEPYQVPYLNNLASKYGMPIANKMLASAMATPGGAAGMKSAFEGDYDFGGPEGTLQDILEKSSIDAESGLQKLIKKRLKKEEEEKEPVKENIIDDLGLRPVVTMIEKGFSMLGFGGKDLTSKDLEAMVGQAASRGDSFTPRSGVDKGIGTAISYLLPGGGFLPQSVGVYRTKNGLEFNVSKDGSLSLDTPTPNIDYGPDTPVIEDKPVEEKKKKKKEEEEKNYMKDYFSGLGSLANTGEIKNYYEKIALKKVYPEKTEEEINIMVNQP